MRCPTADTLRLAWWGATPDNRAERLAALREHMRTCATCRAELARDENGPELPDYDKTVKELERMEK